MEAAEFTEKQNIMKTGYIIDFFSWLCYIYPILFEMCFSGGNTMTYSYNRLWKLLIDKRMTKTDMRKAAGISTNILAKMGKNEPVAMDTLAKITTALECGLDDIVEIQNERKEY